MDGQWSNPAAAEVNGVKEVIFPGGDGWLYGFEAKTGELLWKFDCNPKKSEFKPAAGAGTRNYIVATPVVVDGKLYVGVGREPDAGPGVGHLWCIDLTKKPANKDKDLSPVGDNFDPKAAVNKDSGLVWHYGGDLSPKPADAVRDYAFGRTVSTCAVHDGLVYAADLDGFFYCLDAKTGQAVLAARPGRRRPGVRPITWTARCSWAWTTATCSFSPPARRTRSRPRSTWASR